MACHQRYNERNDIEQNDFIRGPAALRTICSSKHFISPLKQAQELLGPSPSPAVGHQSSCQIHNKTHFPAPGQALGGGFPGQGLTEQPLDRAPRCQPGTSNPASTQQLWGLSDHMSDGAPPLLKTFSGITTCLKEEVPAFQLA